jgi:DinB family protein
MKGFPEASGFAFYNLLLTQRTYCDPLRLQRHPIDAMKTVDPLRQHLIDLLTKAEAHVDIESSLTGFPQNLRGVKPEGAPHTPWQLLEHIRIAQWDILEFSKSGKHKSPKWPDEYWPKTAAPPTDKAWDKSVKQVLADLDAICDLVRDSKNDLTAKLPHGDGQTLLREVLLVADHNSYHLGQLVMVRRSLERK